MELRPTSLQIALFALKFCLRSDLYEKQKEREVQDAIDDLEQFLLSK